MFVYNRSLRLMRRLQNTASEHGFRLRRVPALQSAAIVVGHRSQYNPNKWLLKPSVLEGSGIKRLSFPAV